MSAAKPTCAWGRKSGRSQFIFDLTSSHPGNGLSGELLFGNSASAETGTWAFTNVSRRSQSWATPTNWIKQHNPQWPKAPAAIFASAIHHAADRHAGREYADDRARCSLNSPVAYPIASGNAGTFTLTLDNAGTIAAINVSAGSQTISSQVALTSFGVNTNIASTETLSDVGYDQRGAGGITKSRDAGTLVIGGTNSATPAVSRLTPAQSLLLLRPRAQRGPLDRRARRYTSRSTARELLATSTQQTLQFADLGSESTRLTRPGGWHFRYGGWAPASTFLARFQARADSPKDPTPAPSGCSAATAMAASPRSPARNASERQWRCEITSAQNGVNSVTDSGVLVLQYSGNATQASIISGSGSVILAGGSLNLSGSNSYAGGTSITGDTLAISADDNLGAMLPLHRWSTSQVRQRRDFIGDQFHAGDRERQSPAQSASALTAEWSFDANPGSTLTIGGAIQAPENSLVKGYLNASTVVVTHWPRTAIRAIRSHLRRRHAPGVGQRRAWARRSALAP